MSSHIQSNQLLPDNSDNNNTYYLFTVLLICDAYNGHFHNPSNTQEFMCVPLPQGASLSFTDQLFSGLPRSMDDQS